MYVFDFLMKNVAFYFLIYSWDEQSKKYTHSHIIIFFEWSGGLKNSFLFKQSIDLNGCTFSFWLKKQIPVEKRLIQKICGIWFFFDLIAYVHICGGRVAFNSR